jgi:hypothetical protein
MCCLSFVIYLDGKCCGVLHSTIMGDRNVRCSSKRNEVCEACTGSEEIIGHLHLCEQFLSHLC